MHLISGIKFYVILMYLPILFRRIFDISVALQWFRKNPIIGQI